MPKQILTESAKAAADAEIDNDQQIHRYHFDHPQRKKHESRKGSYVQEAIDTAMEENEQFLIGLLDFIKGNGDRPPSLWRVEELLQERCFPKHER